MRSLVVTAGNEQFMPLLRGLIESLHQWEPRPFTDLACFDLGLAPASRSWIARHAAHIIEPGWDLPVAESVRAEKPQLRGLTVRPFLPRYFPGYDIFLWLDADTWVQERFALDALLALAAEGLLAAVPEVDRAYQLTRRVVEWRAGRMQAYYGQEEGLRVYWETYYNAGVYALRADALHWSHWAKWFRVGLEVTKGLHCSDQCALNYALWRERLPVYPLPALCNWLCHLTVPRFDVQRGCFCEPVLPGHAIGIMHLAANSKDYRIDLDSAGGRTLDLHFRGKVQRADE